MSRNNNNNNNNNAAQESKGVTVIELYDPKDPGVRIDVLEFFYPSNAKLSNDPARLQRWNNRRDLFLLAFYEIQGLKADDPWSFYQIAGIHGLPYEPYDGDVSGWHPQGDTGKSWWGGYCHHGDELFPTWHRPYMLLLEQSIRRQARVIAARWSNETDPKNQAIYTELKATAEELMFPYFDWGSSYCLTYGFPDIFTVSSVKLSFPIAQTIPNPCRSFVLPVDLGSQYSSSDVFNPQSRPNYQVPDDTPYTPKGFSTVRHPNSNYVTDNALTEISVQRMCSLALRPGINAMLDHSDWLTFSNHNSSKDDSPEHMTAYGHYSSVELVHDMVHDCFGGNGGHMSTPDIAAFDPVFWFHHCNVDRLIALWQYAHPKAWIDSKHTSVQGTYTITPGHNLSANTPLTPFRKDSNGHFYTSNEVRYIDQQCGYTYPEYKYAVKHGWTPDHMMAHLKAKYKPSNDVKVRWYLTLTDMPKRSFGFPYRIRVFIDKSDADSKTPTTDPHYAGSLFSFARDSNVTCANCRDKVAIKGSVDITDCLIKLGIAVFSELADDGSDTPAVSPFNPQHHLFKLLRNPLYLDSFSFVFVSSAGTALNPSSIGYTPKPILTWEYHVGDAKFGATAKGGHKRLAADSEENKDNSHITVEKSIKKTFQVVPLTKRPIDNGNSNNNDDNAMIDDNNNNGFAAEKARSGNSPSTTSSNSGKKFKVNK